MIDIVIAAALSALAGIAGNPAPAAAKVVFQCSFGTKQVRVTAIDERLVYAFGSRAKADLVIAGDRKTGNVRYHRTLFAHAEHQQLRFRKGAFSYVVFNRWSSPDYRGEGAEDSSGLLVLKGSRVITRMNCRTGGEFLDGPDFYDWASWPDDPVDLAPAS